MRNIHTITGLRISLASPEHIRTWSSGQVTRPHTINYLTSKPEKDGLFCERTFGPMKDWTCACGKYRRQRTAGFVCEVCGVEVTLSRVRRERMGHIELAAPVVHSWFAHGTPNILAALLDLPPRQLSSVLAYRGYLVTDINESERERILNQPGESDGLIGQPLLASLSIGTFLDEESYRNLVPLYSNCFQAQTGGEAIRALLHQLDLTALAASLRQKMRGGKSHQQKEVKRLRIVEAFRASGTDPSWLVLDVIPVLPPDLRPLVRMKGGRFASSDLNILYERVISQNIRVRRFIERDAMPSRIMCKDEQSASG